jgi:integrase
MALGLHGLRVGEVCRARREDLYGVGCRLHVATLKGGRPRDVPLHESLVSALLGWRGAATHHPWLLFTRPGSPVQRSHLERAARRFTRQVLAESLRFHSLRHTFAMRLYAESRDLFLVQRLLGHRSIKSTEVYLASLVPVPAACLMRIRGDERHQVARPQLRLFSPTG